MARDSFTDVLWQKKTILVEGTETDIIQPLSNVEVTVYLATTSTEAEIYADRIGATPMGNPHTTTDGAVEFWAEYSDYDIKFHDLDTPVRFADKIIGWNATSAAPGGIPSSRLAADAGLGYGSFDASALRQFAPIGGVIDWWRPNGSVPVPTGWGICDGSSVASGDHDFGTGGTITLPNLIGAFRQGANDAASYGSAGTASVAPGIGGAGGINEVTLSLTEIPSHNHGGTTSLPDFTPAAGGNNIYNNGGTVNFRIHTFSGNFVGADARKFEDLSHRHSISAAGGGAAHTNMPKYVGLLPIMKLKRG